MPLITENNWISIVEYSLRNDMSISTIRRQIKDKKIKHTLIRGKYFIYDDNFQAPEKDQGTLKEVREKEDRVHLLEKENDILKKKIILLMEEVSELKMLVGLYEGKGQIKHEKNQMVQMSRI